MWRVTVSSRRSRAFGSRSRDEGVARSSGTGMAGLLSGLVGVPPVGGDVGERRDPDARGVPDVVEQLAETGQARRPADDLGMEGEGGDAVDLGDAVELGQPPLQHRAGPWMLRCPVKRKNGASS